MHNFPDFKQNNTRIAVFGKTTVNAAEKAGLRIDISALRQKYHQCLKPWIFILKQSIRNN